MPLLDLLSKNLIDQSVLFDYWQSLEFGRDNVESVHRSASAANVLYLSRSQFTLHTTWLAQAYLEFRRLQAFFEHIEDLELIRVKVVRRLDRSRTSFGRVVPGLRKARRSVNRRCSDSALSARCRSYRECCS